MKPPDGDVAPAPPPSAVVSESPLNPLPRLPSAAIVGENSATVWNTSGSLSSPGIDKLKSDDDDDDEKGSAAAAAEEEEGFPAHAAAAALADVVAGDLGAAKDEGSEVSEGDGDEAGKKEFAG